MTSSQRDQYRPYEASQKCVTMLAVTVAVVDDAVTVAVDPAGTFERIASAVPAVLVWAGDVMNPAVVAKLTVIPLTARLLTSRTVATIDATGVGPPLTVVTSVTVAGTPVVDRVVVGAVSDVSFVQLTLKAAASRNIQRMTPI
jgi:hypothetical protein